MFDDDLIPPVVTTELWNVTKKPTSLTPFQTKLVPPVAAKPIGDQVSATQGQLKGPCAAESQRTVRSRKDPMVLPVGDGNENGHGTGVGRWPRAMNTVLQAQEPVADGGKDTSVTRWKPGFIELAGITSAKV